jgi:hypothetical protein
MNIKKYKDFSVNEAKATEDEEYDVRQIVAELTQDMGKRKRKNSVQRVSQSKSIWTSRSLVYSNLF